MLTKKNSKKMHANLNKYQVQNWPALPGRNVTSTCNRRVKSFPTGRVAISSQQTGTCNCLIFEYQLKCWEAVFQRCSVKKMFLEISKNSLENTCARVSILIKLQACEISKNTFCYRTPPVAASECWTSPRDTTQARNQDCSN